MTVYRPGDVGVCHGAGALDRLIDAGEWLHGAGRLSRWSHSFVVTDADGGTIEAEGAGVVRAHVGDHPDRLILACPPGVDRAKVVAFAVSQLGDRYNYGQDIWLGLDCLLHTGFADPDKGTWICSELVSAALCAGNWKPAIPPRMTFPSDLPRLLTPVSEKDCA